MNPRGYCSKFKRICYDLDCKDYESCEECLLEAAEITIYKLEDFYKTVKNLWNQVYKHVYVVKLIDGEVCKVHDENGKIKVLYNNEYIDVMCPFCGYDGRIHSRCEVLEIDITALDELNFDISGNVIDGYVCDADGAFYDVTSVYYSKEKAQEVCDGINNR